VCVSLDKAGVILRIKNLVYLRPLEVAELLYQVSGHWFCIECVLVSLLYGMDRVHFSVEVATLLPYLVYKEKETLLQALPETEKEIQERLAHLRSEVAPLLLQKQKIDSHAHRWG